MDINIWISLILILSSVDMTDAGQRLCREDQQLCVVGLCNIQHCSFCTETRSVCKTNNSAEPIPQNLYRLINDIDLTFEGEPVILTKRMFERYTSLTSLKITGRISGFGPQSLHMQHILHNLEITRTHITTLPQDLFPSFSPLRHLLLSHNRLSAIPYSLFPIIKQLVNLDLSYNPIEICDGTNRTIGEAFNHFSNLLTVNLAGLGNEKCQTLPDNFFQPMKMTKYLDLSESHLLRGSQKILMTMPDLSSIILNSIEPYKSCPATANDLFQNLPTKLSYITARGWRGVNPLSRGCILNETSFSLIKTLHVTRIDFANSDMIIGERLRKSLFDGFVWLKELNLSWVRVTSIEPGVFNSMINLAFLSLDGNQLGPRNFDLFTQKNLSQLVTLALSNIGIGSEGIVRYNAEHLLDASPTIKELFFNANLLKIMPRFRSSRKEMYHQSVLVERLTLDDNLLASLSNEEMGATCSLMPNLLQLSVSNNRIDDITGLCDTIQSLVLDDNLIGENSPSNFHTLKGLTNMLYLSMNRNRINNLTNDLVSCMPNLTTLFLAGNTIKAIPVDFFKNNPKLNILDFSENEITRLDPDIFQYSLIIHRIYFQANEITTIPKNVTDILDNLANPSRPQFLGMFDIIGNPFDCNCMKDPTQRFQKWLLNSTYIANVKELTCSGEDPYRIGENIYDYTLQKFHCIYRIPLLITLATAIALIVGASVSIKAYKYRWYIRHPNVVARAISLSLQQVQVEHDSVFDAIVSYDAESDHDTYFVQNHLIPAIEEHEIRASNQAEEGSHGLPLFTTQDSQQVSIL